MRSQTRHHLMLLTLAVVLGSVAYFRPGHEEARPAITLTGLDPGHVRWVDIEIDGNEPVSLRRSDEAWLLEGPVPIPAESARVRSLLHFLAAPSELHYPLADARGAPFGLDRPKLRLTLDGEELVFGDKAPITGLRYVRSGELLHLVHDDLYPLLAGGRMSLVRRTILPPDIEIRRLVLPELRIERDAQGDWICEPQSGSVSPDAIHELLQRWRAARALQVAVARESAEARAVRIELEGKDQPIDLWIVQTEPTLVLVRPDWGLEYHLRASAAERLLVLPSSDPAPR